MSIKVAQENKVNAVALVEMIEDGGRRRYKCHTVGESKCEQSQVESSKVKNIVDNFLRTGELYGSSRLSYGDFSVVLDRQEITNGLIEAQNRFDSLPSKLKDLVGNDPVKLLAFIDNPDDERFADTKDLIKSTMKKYKLTVEPVESVQKVHVVNQHVSSGEGGE